MCVFEVKIHLSKYCRISCFTDWTAHCSAKIISGLNEQLRAPRVSENWKSLQKDQKFCVQLPTTVSHHEWTQELHARGTCERVECIVQNHRDQSSLIQPSNAPRQVSHKLFFLNQNRSAQCCADRYEVAPPAHALAHPWAVYGALWAELTGGAPTQSSCFRAGSRPLGSQHALESLPCKMLGTQSNGPVQVTSSSYSRGFCNVQSATESTRKFQQLEFYLLLVQIKA